MALVSFKFVYWANKVLDMERGGVSLTPPGTWYYGLATDATTVTPTGGQTEVTGGSYARVAITNNLTSYPSASGGSKKNGVAVTFAAPTADWGNCVGLVIYDAATSGNACFFEPFATSIPILNGAPAFSIPVNQETLGES